MGRKPKSVVFKDYEISDSGRARYGHTKFMRITDDQLTHPAFTSLKTGAKLLFVYCKAQEYMESPHPDNDPAAFTMNQDKWTKYGLYTATNKQSFYRDMADLIEHGLIDCVQSGFIQRKKSVYRFSTRWRKWGTESFDVPWEVMTKYMLNKRKNRTPESDRQLKEKLNEKSARASMGEDD